MSVFSVILTSAVVLAEDSTSTLRLRCQEFMSKIGTDRGFAKRTIRLFNFNVSGTNRLIDDLAGAKTFSDAVPLLPLSIEEILAEVKKSITTAQGWVKRYRSFSNDMEILTRSIGRYDGENPSMDAAAEKSGETRDTSIDDLRLKGQIRIFEDALIEIQRRSIEELGYDVTDLFKNRVRRVKEFALETFPDTQREQDFLKSVFPLTLQFPRAPKRVGRFVSLQRPSSLIAQKRFVSVLQLQRFLRNAQSEAKKIKRIRELRDLEQAELLTKLQQLNDAFPKGTSKRLEAMLKQEQAASIPTTTSISISTPTSTQGAATVVVVDAAKELNYLLTYALRDIVADARRLLNSKEEEIQNLKPSSHAVDFINTLTQTDETNGFVRAFSWIDSVRRYMQWGPPLKKMAEKITKIIKDPFILAGSIAFTAGAIQAIYNFTHQKVVEVHNYIVHDPAEIAALNYFVEMQNLRLTISVPATSYKDFYEKFRAYSQDKFSDEAVLIAFEYFFGLRREAKADAERDKGIALERLDGYTKEAEEIKKRRDILMKGYQTKFGSITGVQDRLGRRQYIVWLTEQISNVANIEIKENLQKFLNPEENKPVIETGVAAPESPDHLTRTRSSGDLVIPERPFVGPPAPSSSEDQPSTAPLLPK